jgi:hypothetical protein
MNDFINKRKEQMKNLYINAIENNNYNKLVDLFSLGKIEISPEIIEIAVFSKNLDIINLVVNNSNQLTIENVYSLCNLINENNFNFFVSKKWYNTIINKLKETHNNTNLQKLKELDPVLERKLNLYN